MLSRQRPKFWVRMPDLVFEVIIWRSNMRPKSMKISPSCLTQRGRDVRGCLSNQTDCGLHNNEPHKFSFEISCQVDTVEQSPKIVSTDLLKRLLWRFNMNRIPDGAPIGRLSPSFAEQPV